MKKPKDKEVNKFVSAVIGGGIGGLHGLAKHPEETDAEFKKRLILAATAQPKTKEEKNNELFAYLKSHFLDRLCWWSVSNDGDDFEFEIFESMDPCFPEITIKIYPSGKKP